MRTRTPAVVVLALLAWLPGPAHADTEIEVGGALQTDLHLRLAPVRQGPYYAPLELGDGVARNENRYKLKLRAYGARVTGVVDLDVVWLGVPGDIGVLGDLSLRDETDPYRLEAHALYVEALDVFAQGLDLRIGQQKVMWGVGDQFNPLNTLNAEDLEDPLLFGDQQANFMVRLDYPATDWLSVTAVVVPVFKPALVPLSSGLQLASVGRLPFTQEADWQRFAAEQGAAAALAEHPTVVTSVVPVVPEPTFDNMQAAVQLQTRLGDHDVALSYYQGRTDMPIALQNDTLQKPGEICDPAHPDTCVQGTLDMQITVGYPRMEVYGLNLAGEVDLLGWLSDGIHPIGYRFEGGLFVPESQKVRIFQTFTTLPYPSGEYAYVGDEPPDVVTDEPFAKWTLGLDYSFGEHVYANAQWVHGFVDEYGAGDFLTEGWSVRDSGVVTTDPAKLVQCAITDRDGTECARGMLAPRLADYLVLGVDVRFADHAGLLRLFAILALNGIVEDTWDPDTESRTQTHYGPLSPEGFTAVIYPSLGYNLGDGLEMTVGALFNLGRPYTKFGDPATGGNLAWSRLWYRF